MGRLQNGDWPDKKDSRGKETTMLDWLKEILGESWTEEIDKKVSDEIGKGFVSRSDFNTKNEELKTAKATLKERDGQLEALKKTAGNTEELTKQIEQLQKDNAQKDKDHAAALKALRIDAAAERIGDCRTLRRKAFPQITGSVFACAGRSRRREPPGFPRQASEQKRDLPQNSAFCGRSPGVPPCLRSSGLQGQGSHGFSGGTACASAMGICPWQ